ncbi:MAG: hypothetical protein WC547_01830 [Candidatus Omnitrophota bacterium]
MQLRKSTIMTAVFSLILAGPLFAQQIEQPVVKDMRVPVIVPIKVEDTIFVTGADISLRAALQNQNHYIYWSWLNSSTFVKRFDQDLEKKQLRQQWQDLLGVDVFMPYFKVKEAEDFVSSKTKVTVFNFRGKAHFNENKKQVEYVFRKRF